MIVGLWFVIFGAIFGSAANALIYRLPRQISWTKGKSMCPNCKHELAGSDLIPIFSYLFLRGKCRYCKKGIGSSYMWLELIMAICFGLIGFWLPGALLAKCLLAVVVWATIIIAVMDSKTKLVSEWMVLVWGIAAGGLFYIQNGLMLGQVLLGILSTAGIIVAIWGLSKGKAMGFGDVEIAIVIGLWLGWQRGLVALWVAFITGAVWGGYILFKSRKSKKFEISEKVLKQEMAFGPFLIAGSWIAYFWGDKIFGYVFPF